MRCEDYPCCGHGPVAFGGDGGGCPDSRGRFNCVECGRKLSRKASSSICAVCLRKMERRAFGDNDGYEDGGDFDYSMNY